MKFTVMYAELKNTFLKETGRQEQVVEGIVVTGNTTSNQSNKHHQLQKPMRTHIHCNTQFNQPLYHVAKANQASQLKPSQIEWSGVKSAYKYWQMKHYKTMRRW